jgi:FKBP-type peptidyl-prolyl cis-trans isomerase
MRIIPFLLVVLMSCNGCREQRESQEVITQYKLMKDLVAHNKALHEEEIQLIDDFIATQNWKMTTTGTGLRYWIYQPGSGAQAKLNNVASIQYIVSKFDGTELYRSDFSKPSQFLIGQDNVESGLHEMILLMKVGDKAKVILPSHLAFGLTGDSKKVAQSMPLLYDLELVALD